MSTCAAPLKTSCHRWIYLLIIALIGVGLLVISFQRRSSALLSTLLSEVESAKALDEQIAAFNRINQHGGYGVRLFNAAGKEFDYNNPGSDPVAEVEIFFNNGGRVRTKLVKPGVWGNLLDE
ncbi:MAG: hypothetical protein NTY98_01080 [Verrucomicrobia bacterium]|nr:hypothetical protein [Verrucomicrobiota bacterium]